MFDRMDNEHEPTNEESAIQSFAQDSAHAEDIDEEDLAFDALEQSLEAEIAQDTETINTLKESYAKIGTEEALAETFQNIVREQMNVHLGANVAEAFIEQNHGQTFDPRLSSHVQTSENFVKGKLATHNHEKVGDQDLSEVYKQNYDEYVNKDYESKRREYDADRQKKTNRGDLPKASDGNEIDHIVPLKEQTENPDLAAHLTHQERLDLANSKENLQEIPESANRSKKEAPWSEVRERTKDGERWADHYGLDEKELDKRDQEARKKIEETAKEGERRSEETGKTSRTKEVTSWLKHGYQAIIKSAFAALMWETVAAVIKWIKGVITSLWDAMKSAFSQFFHKIGSILVGGVTAFISMAITSLLKSVGRIIMSVVGLLKSSWRTLKEAWAFLRNPKNNALPFSVRFAKFSSILIAGLVGVASFSLATFFETALISAFPPLATAIPGLGSLASIISIFLSILTAAIVGSLALNLLNKVVEKRLKSDIHGQLIEKQNEKWHKQRVLTEIKKDHLVHEKEKSASNIAERHAQAGRVMHDALDYIFNQQPEDDSSLWNAAPPTPSGPSAKEQEQDEKLRRLFD